MHQVRNTRACAALCCAPGMLTESQRHSAGIESLRRALVRAFATAAIASALGSAACSRPAPDSTPEGAVHLWLDRMEESSEDRRAAREAYALLGPRARANLEERAARASRVHGRQVEPHEMLAEGRFGLRFRPKSMTSTVQGADAIVEVRGGSPESEHATVRCHLGEGTGWRVEPALPEIAPQIHREDGGT